MNKYLYDYFRNQNNIDMSYKVESGDSLYKIANMYGVTVDEIMKANGLTSSLIVPNQVLIIPMEITDEGIYFEEYVVKDDDTLEKIAKKTGVPIVEIAKYNDFNKLKMASNQKIKLPTAYDVYTVTDDDTVQTILDKSKLTPLELLTLNKDVWLKPGTIIYVK